VCFTRHQGCAWDDLPVEFALCSPARIQERLLHQAKELLGALNEASPGESAVGNLFDYVDVTEPLAPSVERSYWKGILRGTHFQPVFAEKDGRLSPKVAWHANRLVELLAEEGRILVHTALKGETSIPLTSSETTTATLGFVAGAKKIHEKDIPTTDPRRAAIEKYRQQYPGGVPVWLEGTLAANLSLGMHHWLPLSPFGAMVNFGFDAGAKTEFTFHRLAYFSNPAQDGLAQSKTQIKRLSLTPLKPENFKDMEDGARFKIRGEANLRLYAGLGLGATIPALENIPALRELTRAGAAVEVGATASLSGAMEAEIVHKGAGRVTFTLGNDLAAEAGLHLKAFAGVAIDREALDTILQHFITFATSGGQPEAFLNSLKTEVDKELATSMTGYISELNKNIASGVSVATASQLATTYSSIAFEARKGFGITGHFSTSVDFDLAGEALVDLPRADMVPPNMRQGRAPRQTLSLKAGELASLAYSLAIRGDLRLVQQLQYIRGSGVTINEQPSSLETSETNHVSLHGPLIHFRHETKEATTNIDRFTTELGRTHTLVESFNHDYRGLFGDRDTTSVKVRVHGMRRLSDPKERLLHRTAAQLTFPDDDNFSSDYVIQSLTDNWTSFEDMQDFMGVYDALSEGALTRRCAEALATGAQWLDAQNFHPIRRFFEELDAFGQTTAHLHVWLGEPGLESLFQSEWTEDDLYRRIGEVFSNIELVDGEPVKTLPRWAMPGAQRSLKHRGQPLDTLGGSASLYGLPKDPNNRLRLHSDQEGLATARYLVDNIQRLSRSMRRDLSPNQEGAMATEIRDFLADCKDRLAAYAALAMLVPESQRAVEMRVTSLKEGKAPIRFTCIQDGRSSEILRATGFAKAAITQFRLYGTVLDYETQRRMTNLLKELHTCINAPSPDPFTLKRVREALQNELTDHFDPQALALAPRIERDMLKARDYVDTLPDSATILRILPGALGAELANLRLNTGRELRKSLPTLTLLRAQLKNLMQKAPLFREITQSNELITTTGSLGYKLRDDVLYAAEVKEAAEAIEQYRQALKPEALDPALINAALQRVTDAHQALSKAAIAMNQGFGEISRAEEAPALPRPDLALNRDLAGERDAATRRALDTLKVRSWQPLSYFERMKIVPPTAVLMPSARIGETGVTTSQLRRADLTMANRLRKASWRNAGVPHLATAAKIKELQLYASAGSATTFLDIIQRDLRWTMNVPFSQPETALMDNVLTSLPTRAREAFLEKIPKDRKLIYRNIFLDIDADTYHARRRSPIDANDHLARTAPELTPYLKRFETFLNEKDYAGLALAMEQTCSLGILNQGLTTLNQTPVTCLEEFFNQLDGHSLENLCRMIKSSEEKTRFLAMIKSSNLLPATRARLAGQLVSQRFFWKDEASLVEALVTGMTPADLRLFFDNMYADGTLERFLKAGSWWQTLLEVFTLGLARLWTHDNAAALRVVAAQGWSGTELKAQYNTRLPLSERVEDSVESVLLGAIVNSLPVNTLVASGIYAAHSIARNVKYSYYTDFPHAALDILANATEGAAETLVERIVAIATNGGTREEIAADYKRFFVGLDAKALEDQLKTDDQNETLPLIAKALRDGALENLREEAKAGTNPILTTELVDFLATSARNDAMDSEEATEA